MASWLYNTGREDEAGNLHPEMVTAGVQKSLEAAARSLREMFDVKEWRGQEWQAVGLKETQRAALAGIAAHYADGIESLLKVWQESLLQHEDAPGMADFEENFGDS